MACINPNDPKYKEILERVDNPILAELEFDRLYPSELNYSLKSIDILSSEKAIQIFQKGEKAKWPLVKILQELQIPKEQQTLILDSNLSKREEILSYLLGNYSYAIEINIAKEKGKDYEMVDRGDGNFEPEPIEPELDYDEVLNEEGNIVDVQPVLTEKGKKQIADMEDIKPTQYYSNLTVPGGTNYTENEIATPAITPSIKGHGAFSTEHGVGWFRSDEQKLGGKFYSGGVFEGEMIGSITHGGKLNPIKTRRILEIQSDLFQKGRNKENLVLKEETKYNANEEEGDIHPLLNNDELEDFDANEFLYKTLSNEIIGTKDWGYGIVREDNDNYYFETGDNKYSKISKVKYNEEKIRFAKLEKEQLKDTREKAKQLKENQFLQLLNKDNNWVTFFVKSIVQQTAKERIYEASLPDIEEKVLSLQKDGKLKIDCK